MLYWENARITLFSGLEPVDSSCYTKADPYLTYTKENDPNKSFFYTEKG